MLAPKNTTTYKDNIEKGLSNSSVGFSVAFKNSICKEGEVILEWSNGIQKLFKFHNGSGTYIRHIHKEVYGE